MGFLVGMILFGIPSAIIANNKGFAPLRWLLAFGFIGLITVSCLGSARTKDITSEESWARADKANRVGAWMTGINLATGALALFAGLALTS